MKKLLKNLLFLSAIGSVAFLYSCGGDDEVLPDAPTMEIEVEGVEVSGRAISAVEGETATFTVTVTAAGKFNTLNIYASVDGTENPTPQSIARTAANVTLNTDGTEATIVVAKDFEAGDVDKDLAWRFEAVDDENQTAEITFTATVEAAPVEVKTHTQVLIGGQSNATLGSFYDADGNNVYKYAETRETHSAKVDFLFFYGETNKYAIAAMDDADANTAFSAALNVTNALSAVMPTRNATKFKVTTLTAAQFDEIANVEQLANAYGEVAADGSKVNNLEAGKVFAFVQASSRGSKKGLVKVVETSGTSGTNRAITITVKIEPETEG